jgi:hypothetical protein
VDLSTATEKVREYVSTDGFGKIMCLHLRGGPDWWRRGADRGSSAGEGAKGPCGQEKGEGAQDCPPCTGSQGEAGSQGSADHHYNLRGTADGNGAGYANADADSIRPAAAAGWL